MTIDPVHHDETGWWFWTETWADRIGPFVREDEARTHFELYCRTILRDKGSELDVLSPEHPNEVLTKRERGLAELLYQARTALWREWAERGSETARQAFERTDPKHLE